MKYVFEGEVSESQKTYFILEKRQKEKNTNTLLQKSVSYRNFSVASFRKYFLRNVSNTFKMTISSEEMEST